LFASTNVIIFDLNKNQVQGTIPIEETIAYPAAQQWGEQRRVLSPDGNILVDWIYLNGQGIYAFDLLRGALNTLH